MSTDIPRYSTPRLRAFALWAQALSGEGNSLGDVLQTYVDNWADDIEALAQPQPSLSQKMLAAGYTPRDRKIECDECGAKVSPQMMPLHDCAQPQQQPEAPELTDDEIMRCIDDEFPVSLVDPIVLQKVYSVCRSVLASQPKPLPPSLTDKEIWKLWLTTEAGPYDFARAVLAAQAAKGTK